MFNSKMFSGVLCALVSTSVLLASGCSVLRHDTDRERGSGELVTGALPAPKEQPDSLIGLFLSLFKSKEETEERIGPTESPKDLEIPEPPKIKILELSEITPEMIASISGQLKKDFELAKVNDPLFQSALYEFQVGEINADVASLAYTPKVQLSNQFLENENNSRTTFRISQPVFNVRLLATVKEADSRRAMAEAKMRTRENQLSERVFDAVAALVQAREQLDVNAARIDTLNNALTGAKRSFELGTGSITDVRDAETRLAQAKAQQFKFDSDLRAASRQIRVLTGKEPSVEQYQLRRENTNMVLQPLDSLVERALSFNPDLIEARAQQRLAELGALKAKGAYMPTLDLVSSRSISDSGDTRSSGLTFGLSVPIEAGSFYEAAAATANINIARLNAVDRKARIQSDLEQRYFDVDAGLQQIGARLTAIEAAKVSLIANQKSFDGGVRTRLDVLNSIETLYLVNQEYVRTVVEFARNYLLLNNLSSKSTGQTIEELQAFLFVEPLK